MKIIFSGGGTLGPVTPLLAIYEILKNQYPEAECLWVGTKNGPEKKLILEKGIRFSAISAGKFRRYLSLWNIVDVLKIIIGFFQSLYLIVREKPAVCISAGGFVSVPLHLSAWLLGIPSWIHQQDIEVGMSNKIMAPFAKVITTTLKENLISFKSSKSIWLGNPVRREILAGDKDEGIKLFNLNSNLPVIFVIGGGTGSMRVNQLIVESIQYLKDICQVVHLTGLERPQELIERTTEYFGDYYHAYQFFSKEMKYGYAVADIVISRGGFGTLSELSALGKTAIIIPKPGHQENNVKFLADAGSVIMVNEKTANGNYLARIIKELLEDNIKRNQLFIQLQNMLPMAKGEEIIRIFEITAGITK